MEKSLDSFFYLHVQGRTQRVMLFYHRIVMVVKLGNYMRYHHLKEERPPATETWDVKGTIRKFHLLERPEFIIVKSGTIINRLHVVDCYKSGAQGRQLTLLMSNGDEVEVARKYVPKIKELYFPHGKIMYRKKAVSDQPQPVM